jgi:hypothetical protein
MTKKYILGLQHRDQYFIEGERQRLKWIPDADITHDMDQLRADSRPKILMINVFNPGGEFPCQGDYSWVDLIIGMTDEFINVPLPVIYETAKNALNNQNVIFISGGKVEDPTNSNRLYHPLLCWINHVYVNNDYTPSPLPAQKPYKFDVLLGQNRPHRLYLFYKLLEDNLLDSNLVSIWRHGDHSYFDLTRPEIDDHVYEVYKHNPLIEDLVKKYGIMNFYRSPVLDQLELPDLLLPKDDPINYTPATPTSRYCKARPGAVLSMAMDMPIKIFDASWYSIVAETLYLTDELFITEKIGKRLMAKRVFVLFGARGCLEYLRSQGFRTFNGIIDESYDLEPNDRRRFDMAWEQVRLLNTLDPVEVYRQAESVLEHNYNLLPELKNEHLKIRDFIAQWLPT